MRQSALAESGGDGDADGGVEIDDEQRTAGCFELWGDLVGDGPSGVIAGSAIGDVAGWGDEGRADRPQAPRTGGGYPASECSTSSSVAASA
jgi:hypothetical protein